MSINSEKLYNIIKKNFPDAKINLIDTAGDQNHYSLEITDNSFANKSLIDQHKMVKSALAEILKGELHAITIKTRAE